jgi:hypothetical protein
LANLLGHLADPVDGVDGLDGEAAQEPIGDRRRTGDASDP